MNIQAAKTEIKNALQVYHRTDGAGNYLCPTVRQRPILLIGPPGVGKTAILEQVAAECGVGLVAYTMTHHTRQSAIGLPHIEKKRYGGEEVMVTEYTMSEIIASIHDCMTRTGKSEGILFLDEINCVSETLAPTMLQLLQNKTFGTHKIPDGWLIVAAGNPPEYNKSVREFDMATLDRVRYIPVEADWEVWMEYAREQQIHGAILSYLTIKPRHFYTVEDRAEGKAFVTARGWEDLSEVLKGYEALEFPVSGDLVRQYLRQDEVAGAFAAYYALYRRYGEDYGIPELLRGGDYGSKLAMARQGGFEERFTVIRLLLDALDSQFVRYTRDCAVISRLHRLLPGYDGDLDARRKALQVKVQAELLSPAERQTEEAVLTRLAAYNAQVRQRHCWTEPEAGAIRKALFAADADELRKLAQDVGLQLERAFRFAEDCFGDGQEMVLLVSGLAHNSRALAYLRVYGCDAFLRHSDILLYRRQEKALQQECAELLN